MIDPPLASGVPERRVRWPQLLIGALFALLGLVLVRTAWVCDDAYITFRTIENALHGHGLRWNVAERVQTYTHPLWMLLVLLGRVLVGEVYVAAVGLGLLCSLGAVLVLCVRIAANQLTAAVAVLALIGSRAFVDYSTSGLENSLTHLLLVLFVASLLHRPVRTGSDLLRLSLLAALLMLNRIDAILLVAPALGLAIFRHGPRRSLSPVLVGFAPMWIWVLFAFFYYGTPFPNTAYAKAFATGIAPSALAAQSVHYFVWVLEHDPLTPIVILVAVIHALLRKNSWCVALAAGVLLQLLYIVKVGGDFMGGRFFAAPFVLSVAMLARFPLLVRADRAVIALIVVFGLGIPGSTPTWLSGADFGHRDVGKSGITDERAYYYSKLGLLSPERELPEYGVLAARLFPEVVHERIVAIYSIAGVVGFEAGPRMHLVDLWLCDPLLVRLPAFDPDEWRIGHFTRRIPEGYLETLVAGENRIQHPGLARYYADLACVVRGDLFAFERLRALARLWTGAREEGRAEFVANEYRDPPRVVVPIGEVSQEPREGSWWFSGGVRFVLEGGLRLQWPEPQHAARLELGLDRCDTYRITFLRGTEQSAETYALTENRMAGLQTVVVKVPTAAAEAGYDRIDIDVLRRGDAIGALGWVRVDPE